MFDAGTLRYAVLQRIAEQPRHGYEIIKAIEEQSGGAYSPSAGMIYPMLSLLEDRGYIAVAQEANRKLYTITREGQVFLEENRAFVEAVEARMNSRRVACSGAIRQAMQTLKEVLATRIGGQNLSEAQLNQIEAVLRRAAAEIQVL